MYFNSEWLLSECTFCQSFAAKKKVQLLNLSPLELFCILCCTICQKKNLQSVFPCFPFMYWITTNLYSQTYETLPSKINPQNIIYESVLYNFRIEILEYDLNCHFKAILENFKKISWHWNFWNLNKCKLCTERKFELLQEFVQTKLIWDSSCIFNVVFSLESQHFLLDLSQLCYWKTNVLIHIFMWKNNVYKQIKMFQIIYIRHVKLKLHGGPQKH